MLSQRATQQGYEVEKDKEERTEEEARNLCAVAIFSRRNRGSLFVSQADGDSVAWVGMCCMEGNILHSPSGGPAGCFANLESGSNEGPARMNGLARFVPH